MTKEKNKIFLKVNHVQKIIDGKNKTKTFYTTKDSHCSSLLEPKKTEYNKWYGAHRFKVVKKEQHKVSSLNSVLKDLNINYIDWLVIDAQGVDLSIFNNIDKKIQSKISILDLEPGFFEFYKKADSISEVDFFNGSLLFVQFFFVLSGFVLAHSYCEKKITFNSFILGRIFRIFPLHLSMLLLMILFHSQVVLDLI